MIYNYLGFNDYVSMFNINSFFEEFVDKNISFTNLQDMKSYILDSEINWDRITVNVKANQSTSNNNEKNNINNIDKSITSELNGNPIEQNKWHQYISTLNFLNDLVTISEMLKFIPLDCRNKALRNFIRFMNTMELPSSNISFDFSSNRDISNELNNKIILRICEDYSFCLSTKDKVPFHILLEICNQPNITKDNNQHKRVDGIIDMKTTTFKSSHDLFRNFNDNSNSLNKSNTVENSFFKIEEISYHKEIFKPIPIKPVKEKKSFFANIFGCCGIDRAQEDIEQEESERITSYEQTKDNSSYLHGLFGDKTFTQVSQNLLKNSKHDHLKNRKIISIIVKGNEDMRQDQLVYQVMEIFSSIFEKENLNIYLKPLKIIPTGRGGIIETLTNTTSLQKIKGINYEELLKSSSLNSLEDNDTNKDFVDNNENTKNPNPNNLGKNTKTESGIYNSTSKKNNPLQFYSSNTIATTTTVNYGNLKSYFILKFGNVNSSKYKQAVNNFMISLVGYSLLCYVLEIKDRNNGNILVDDEGHIIHIDFGFLLSHSPGNLNFEKAPFKLTSEFVEILNEFESDLFKSFQDLFWKGFMALRNNVYYIISFIDLFMLSNSDLPCFYKKEMISDSIREKLMCDYTFSKFMMSESDSIKEFTNNLILYSYENWRTKFYDNYQKYCVGIN